MKSTTKAIFSLGLISFLTLGGICQNAFAGQTHTANHHSVTKKAKKPVAKKPATKTPGAKTPAAKTPGTTVPAPKTK
ncbi:MAG: hypothetical protein WCO29_19495 [Nostocales cyanobacterium ELA583]|jgi:hypothetical protein